MGDAASITVLAKQQHVEFVRQQEQRSSGRATLLTDHLYTSGLYWGVNAAVRCPALLSAKASFPRSLNTARHSFVAPKGHTGRARAAEP